MANRRFNQFRYSLENAMCDIYAKVAIGAAGAPTLDVAKSKGVASIVRDSAGLYTVTLADAYVDLFMVQATVELTAGSPASSEVVVRAYDVSSAKTVQIGFLSGAYAATDLASGAVLKLKFELKNSRV